MTHYTNSDSRVEVKNCYIVGDPHWDLLQAAKGALLRIDDLIDSTVELQPFLSDRLQGMFSEFIEAEVHLRSAIRAVEEAGK